MVATPDKCLILKDMATESATGTTGVNMKETGRMIWQVAKEILLMPTVIFTKVCGKITRDMGMVKRL